MSKEVQVGIYIDDNVSSVKTARDMVERAWFKQKALKAELWGLIMATPKDITAEGEDPIDNLKERFEDIWESLWDAFVNDYKYTAVADDAELNKESLVTKVWAEEKRSLEELCEEERKRSEFFDKFRGVLSPYNFDDHKLYEEFKEGNVIITEPLTAEQRAWHLAAIKKREEKVLEEALKRIKDDDKEKSI